MAFDAFIKIDGIPGDSTDRTHKGEIDVLSFAWGVSQGTTAGCPAPSPPGTAQVQDFSIVKVLDSSSPLLFSACCSGQVIKSATVTCRRAADKPVEFYKVEMSNVLISSVRPGGATGAGGAVPMEEVSFSFGGVQIEYTAQDQSGKPKPPVKSFCLSPGGGT